jgi:two-component SAPR family response regulator
MKRTLARLGLLAVLAGTPLALRFLVGAPAIPSFSGSDGLSGSYVSPDAVLALVGLLSWVLWAYLTFAVLLHSLAIVAVSRNAPGQRNLLAASTMLTPKVVRAVVELAIGSALVTASVTVRASSALPAVSHVPPAHTASVETAGVTLASADHRESSRETYRVRQGDSLWRIAERQLGSGFRWREIFRLNEGRRFPDDRSLIDPHLIFPGWVLELPETEGAGDGHPPEAAHQHKPEDRPAAKGSTTPAPSMEASPSSPARPTPPDEADPEIQPDDDQVEATGSHGPTVELPSGLLAAASFASGLLTAHLLGRLHRRRSRRLTGVESVEPPVTPDLIRDLRRAGASEMAGPIDVALDVVIDAWVERAGSWPHVLAAVESASCVWVVLADDASELPPSSGGTLSPGVRFARSGSCLLAEVNGPFPPRLRRARTPLEQGLLVPLGRAADGSVVHVSVTGLGHVAVSGTGESSLQAQFVLAAATRGGPEELQLVLLGQGELMTSLARLPQVVTCRGWEEAASALREIELELMRRARLFVQEGVEDIWTHLAERSDEQLPAAIVVCKDPQATGIGTIDALGQQAAKLGVAVLTSGATAGTPRLAVRVDRSIELETDLPLPSSLEPLSLDEPAQEEAISVIVEAYPSEAVQTSEGSSEQVDPPDLSRASVQAEAPPRVISPAEMSTRPREEQRMPPPGKMAISCLGPFEISRGEEPIRSGWKAKGRELLAYLVANPAGAPKERIIEELWPEIDPKRAGARFDRSATVIRSLARGTDDARMYVERVGESSYRLEPDAWWIDAWEFERLVRKAVHREDPATAVSDFREALSLYGGEFCDDSYYPWLEGARERFRNLFVEASARLAYLLSETGRYDDALAVLDRAIRVDPLCEDLIRRAMAIEAALGRRAAALTRYHRFEAILDEQLGVEPDAEMQEQARRLSGPTARAG